MSTNFSSWPSMTVCEFNTRSSPTRCTQRMQLRREACSIRSSESSKNVDFVLSASFIEIVGRKLSWKQRKQQLRGWRRELERCRRPGCGYFSDLSYRSRNKTPSEAVPREELWMRWTMDDRLVRITSSVILSKTWNLNKPLRRRRVAGMRTTSSRHHTWRSIFFLRTPFVICCGKKKLQGGTKIAWIEGDENIAKSRRGTRAFSRSRLRAPWDACDSWLVRVLAQCTLTTWKSETSFLVLHLFPK